MTAHELLEEGLARANVGVTAGSTQGNTVRVTVLVARVVVGLAVQLTHVAESLTATHRTGLGLCDSSS